MHFPLLVSHLELGDRLGSVSTVNTESILALRWLYHVSSKNITKIKNVLELFCNCTDL